MLTYYTVDDFNGVEMFQNERNEILSSDSLCSDKKIDQLNLLALTAFRSGLKDFSMETFKMSFEKLSKPYDFYQFLGCLRMLKQTDFSFLVEEFNAVLYNLSENNQVDLTDKLLLKLKLFEFSNAEFSEKLNNDILYILLNNENEYRINHSLSDSLPDYLIYLIVNNYVEVAKGLLVQFQEYLIDIVEQMILLNKKSDQ